MSTLASRTLENLAFCFIPSEQRYEYDFKKDQIEEKNSILNRINHYAVLLFKVSFHLLTIPVGASLTVINTLKNKSVQIIKYIYQPKQKVLSEEELSKLLQGKVEQFGFSDSLFQSCGLGTKFSKPSFLGKCDWDSWLDNPKDHIEGDKDDIQTSFRNYLDDPNNFVKLLKSLGVTAYRFSLERSVIQPEKDKYDQNAINKYLNLCKCLKEAGIEPWVTLNHFVQPKWFAESGGFSAKENVIDFVKYADTIVPQFKQYVTNWMTFNEPGVDAFQREIRMKYPNGKGSINAAIQDMQNILLTHYAIYKKIKTKFPDLNIGITHQWLRFVPANDYNLIERIACFALSLITHYAVFNCLKTGSLRIPFLTNIRLWNEKKSPFDFIGVQAYGFPVLKVGFGSGKEPGVVSKFKIPGLNYYFVTGATCKEEGGKVSSFGPPYAPDDLEKTLEEAKELKAPIAITETGCDANEQHWGEKEVKLDEKTQKEYFEKIFNILTRFKLNGLFIWTLFRNQLEWENGTKKIKMGVISDTRKYNGKIKKIELNPAAIYLQNIFKKMLKMKKPQST
jgi:beta-glucosidase/6-phospho-beta-glucosidase/beta-galactosidase